MSSDTLNTRRIKLLPDDLINRIAAGEVVERPAAVLKELVENSLDAGADRIDIEVAGGGKKLIRVRDNGRGMNEDDLFLCLERHATSKLSAEADLMRIATLGFRGEALPSIASVSNLSITSAIEGGEGHIVRVNGGRMQALEAAPANRGTTVEVANLFYNVPARRKFLKSDHTESGHLLEVAQSYALSRDGLSLTFREGGREVLSVEARHDFKTRVLRVLGRAAAESLTPFEFQDESVTISGWLGGPERAIRSTGNLFVYVLGRPVKDRLVNRAVADGYGRLLPPGNWPAAVIFIGLDPEDVDVNVHPAKAEVRFRRPGAVFSALSSAIGRTVGFAPPAPDGAGELAPVSKVPAAPPLPPLLRVAPATPPPESIFPDLLDTRGREEIIPPWMRPEPAAEGVTSSGFAPAEAPGGREAGPPASEAGELEAAPEVRFGPPEAHLLSEVEPQGESPAPSSEINPGSALDAGQAPIPGAVPARPNFEELRPLAQLYHSYILAEGSRGLYIIDQHAAHERIVYNQLKERLAQGIPGQSLLFPDTMDLPPQEALAAEKLQSHLAHIGFDLQPFGDRTFILKSAPAILNTQDPWPPLLEMLGAAQGHLKSLEGAGMLEALQAMANSWFYSIACRAAVKAGYKMSLEAMAQLIDDMARTPNGAYCPHGRPAIWLIDRFNIEKRFDRR